MKWKITPALCLAALMACIQPRVIAAECTPAFGPFHAMASGSGPGHTKWFDGNPPTEPTDAWTITAWVKPKADIAAPTLVAGFGDGIDYLRTQRFLAADSTGWFFWYGGLSLPKKNPDKKKIEIARVPDRLSGCAVVKPGVWQHLAVTYDGRTLSLHVDGVSVAQSDLPLKRAAMQAVIAPPAPWKDGAGFEGKVAEFTIWSGAMDPAKIASLSKESAELDSRPFAAVPSGATPGYRAEAVDFANGSRDLAPQAPDTLPKPVPSIETERKAKLHPRPVASPKEDGTLWLDRGWEMADASAVKAKPESISLPGFATGSWYDATVPGTALTTLVQQGVYPEPTHGLNNMLIPDLATKSWWYRVEFPTPAAWKGSNVELLFKGINYHAAAWLNGRPLGEVTGAFLRGRFDATPALVSSGTNVLAVRVWPQPHYSPGTGEPSVKFGAGPNGAEALLDGPTFFCTEGWDWNPATRDRCTGIWQDVLLRPTGAVTVEDPHIITKLPQLPDLSVAEVTLQAEVRNLGSQPQEVTLEASLAKTKVAQKLSLSPGETRAVTLSPKEFPQLNLKNPRLWWPNGYGEPTLHDLTLRVVDSKGKESARIFKRVGLRQMDYDYLPRGAAPDPKSDPFLVKVNGRRVFVHGGNWGLDELLKRSSTERLETAFRLHREAHLNMVRNWCGQTTQDNFYELADRYGMLVWNDFWLSTEGHNVPAIDAERFLANAEDVIKRYRSHASIAVWCGRNEGTPPPWLNTPLGEKIQSLDGTRIYIPNSRGGNLLGSGPWTYRDPASYFGGARGFTTELGINSIPSVDGLRAMLHPSQVWPWKENDAWAYHDYSWAAHGVVAPFRESAEIRYGTAEDLEGFIRRMQMVNYTHHRVMTEAFNSKMWQPATGMLYWMTHPAWPSMVWQIYSYDFETYAAYFGTKKACEPLHVQWNLDDNTVAVVNSTHHPVAKATLKIRLFSLNGTLLKESAQEVYLKASEVVTPAKVEWAEFDAQPVQFLRLELRDSSNQLLSENFYWHSVQPEQMRAMEKMAPCTLAGNVRFTREGNETVATVNLTNPGKQIALMTHLVLRNAKDNERILPAFASDNYLNLLPGEKKTVTIRCANKDAKKSMVVSLDGWNIIPATLR